VKSNTWDEGQGIQRGQRGAKNQLPVDKGQDKDHLRGYEDNEGHMQRSTIQGMTMTTMAMRTRDNDWRSERGQG